MDVDIMYFTIVVLNVVIGKEMFKTNVHFPHLPNN